MDVDTSLGAKEVTARTRKLARRLRKLKTGGAPSPRRRMKSRTGAHALTQVKVQAQIGLRPSRQRRRQQQRQFARTEEMATRPNGTAPGPFERGYVYHSVATVGIPLIRGVARGASCEAAQVANAPAPRRRPA